MMRTAIAPPPDEFEEYRLVRPLGRGAMGQVFLARDTLLDRFVAVKFISAVDPRARERFLVEARAAARLSHPNVVAVYRVGELEGRPYLVSEFIRGSSLDKLERPVPAARVLELGIGLARGLAVAHRRGVLHRDIKPANAMLADDGDVKLLDFGLAKLLDPASADDANATPDAASDLVPPTLPAGAPNAGRLTQVGAVMGTPYYMAPELWRGEPATPRADVYALGALLYELAAGSPPFRAFPVAELAVCTQTTDAPAIASVTSAIDARLASVIDRCLARDPARRYASGDVLRDALEQLVGPATPAAELPTGNPYRGLRPFEAEHRAVFFGRSVEIRTVVDRLRAEPFVLVSGDSGAGKSSLCRAGVLPHVADGALAGGRTWTAVTIAPGKAPVATFGDALAGSLGDAGRAALNAGDVDAAARAIRGAQSEDRGLLVFVDQLEELVTLSAPAEAEIVARLLSRLAVPFRGVRLLATCRGDMLTRIARLPDLADDTARALYLLGPISDSGLHEVIVGPARATGVRFEDNAVVDELAESAAADGLPLLQFALAELWERRRAGERVIPTAALAAIGGVTGALARHADDVLAGLLPARRTAARRALLRMVTPDETRARVLESELVAGDPDTAGALDALVRARIVVARQEQEGTAYELAHEGLIRGWRTFAEWLHDDAARRWTRERVARAAAEWVRLGHARDALFRDRQLAEAAALGDDVGASERAFLLASRRAVRRQRAGRIAAALAVPLVIAAAFAGMRVHRAREVDRDVRERLTESDRLADDARARGADADRRRAAAFAAFDAGDAATGEARWDEALAASTAAAEAWRRVSDARETALLVDADREDTRAALADAIYERMLLAERDRRRSELAALSARLALYDGGGVRQRRWEAPAHLAIRSTAPFVVRAWRDHRWIDLERHGELAITLELAPGSYLLESTAGVRQPVYLARGEAFDVELAAPPVIPDGFVWVPAGRWLVGSGAADETYRKQFQRAAPLHEIRSGDFLIARSETTWREWIAWLRALPPDQRRARTPRVASREGAVELAEIAGGGYELRVQPSTRAYVAKEGEPIVYAGRARHARQDWLAMPVTAISWDDARAYAAWLDASGRVPGARLCDEREWEHAARGADGRSFPNGVDALGDDDANFDETYGRVPEAMGPDAVGSHPASDSPYAIHDLAGNVFEWTVPALRDKSDVRPARGGAFPFDVNAAHTEYRELVEATARNVAAGLRVCATPERAHR